MSFAKALAFVLSREGGYVNDAFDRGGATLKGITQTVYNKFRADCRLTPQGVTHMTDDEMQVIYKGQYWEPAKCALMPEPLDLAVFDSAVQHGVKTSARLLQRALGVPDDGAIGPQTLDALGHADIGALIEDYIAERERFYGAIIDRDATQVRYAKGWNNRLALLKQATETA